MQRRDVGLRVGLLLLHPAGALEGEQLGRVGRGGQRDPGGQGAEVDGAGLVGEVGSALGGPAYGLVGRHAAIRAWSPESSTSGTSWPRQVAGLV